MTELDQHNFQHLSRRSIIPLLPPSFAKPPAVHEQRLLAEDDTALDAKVDDLPDLNNVQGDVIHLFPKKAEVFVFFRIADVAQFKTALRTFKVSSSNDVIQFLHTVGLEKRKAQGRKIGLISKSFTQIAFTRMGMNFMNEREPTGDPRFDTHAMRDDREFLGDQAQWDKLFDKPHPDPVHGSANDDEGALHGVISIAGSDSDNAKQAADAAKAHFGTAIVVRSNATINGQARPGDWAGHEHFGYQDGISQPALRGLSKPWPGQIVVDPGVIVMGYKGDPVLDDPYAPIKRPLWARDGTIMVFRKLEQFVPEFDDYLDRNGRRWKEFAPGGASCELTDKEGAELWGARMIGRWKSGAPVQRCPVRDDPAMGKDNNRNNDFDYHIRDDPKISPDVLTGYYCPFIAHTRKTVPRSLDPYIQRRFMDAAMIVRAGLPYGIEVTDKEKKAKQSDPDMRGLLFVSYQAGLDQGFVRQTTVFGNNDWFPTTSLIPSRHGQDTVIGGPPVPGSASDYTEVQFTGKPSALPKTGQEVNWTLVSKESGETISVTGFAGVKPTGAQPPPGVPQEFFVTSHGGEYFFVPSIKTLRMWANDGKTGGL